MRDYLRKLKPKNFHKKNELWEMLIALRLYIIVFIMVYPFIFFFINLKYLSPFGIIILGFSALLIIKYVLFESQIGLIRYFKTLFCIMLIIIFNFIISLIYFINYWNLYYILFISYVLIGSTLYFILTVYFKVFKKINSFIITNFYGWVKSKNVIIDSKTIFKKILFLWSIISIMLIVVPYPVYFQNNNIQINTRPHRDFGFWTYGQSLNDDNIGEPEYITNQTLEMLGDADVYFVYGLNVEKIDIKLIKNLIRCRDHRIEVHISVNPLKERYTNIWTFENLRDDIEKVLKYLDSHGLIGNPVTALVYDMEVMPDAKYPFYGLKSDVVSKLNEYNDIETKFRRFNNKIKNEYDLDIRITTDISQGFDLKDGDNDLMVFSGLISYEKADMAYMVYRRDMLGQNVILDHCRFLDDGDIIILNAWRDMRSLCWKNLDCAIKDAQLVLGYPKKAYRLEFWSLSHFLYSFGENGLIDLVDAINQDVSEWSKVNVWNIFPYSFFWDSIFFGYIIIDLYGPIFRMIYKIF